MEKDYQGTCKYMVMEVMELSVKTEVRVLLLLLSRFTVVRWPLIISFGAVASLILRLSVLSFSSSIFESCEHAHEQLLATTSVFGCWR